MPDFSNPDTLVPVLIIAGCLLLSLITFLLTGGRKRAAAPTVVATAPVAPIVGQTQVTQAQLGAWHRAHGATVKQWIENHEQVLRRVSDGGMAIDLSADLSAGHDELGPAIEAAIAAHPTPQMRAQLSALVLASRNTIQSLRRSNWSAAEKEHVAYLEYRDTWLDRLRQFTTAESQVQDLRKIGAGVTVPGWLDANATPPG